MPSSMYDTGYKNVSNAANTGKQAISSFDPTGFGSKTKQGFSDLWGSQQGQQQDYIQGFKDTIAGQTGLPEAYSSLNAQYNVPTLAANANYLQGQVLKSPQRNLQMAKGFNFDQNQVDKATNLELARLSPLAQNATNQLQTAQGMVNQGVGFQQAQNQYELQPIQQEGEMLGDFWARQASGFTSASQMELEGLVKKMEAGVQLSTAEMQRYSELAQAEMDYQAAMTQANTQMNVAKLNNQNQIIGQGQTYYNPATGFYYSPYSNVRKP